MKFKKLFLAASAFFAFSTALSALPFTMDISVPVKMAVVQQQVELNGNYRDAGFINIPLMAAGPVRCQYIFNPETDGKWTFGAGASAYVWPFQTLSVCGTADYRLYTFSNSGSLHLVNILDAGIYNCFSSYFDVNQGKYVTKANVSPVLEYGLELVYRSNGNFKGYIGFGPGAGGAVYEGVLKIYYGFNVDFGMRIGSK